VFDFYKIFLFLLKVSLREEIKMKKTMSHHRAEKHKEKEKSNMEKPRHEEKEKKLIKKLSSMHKMRKNK
jgi:DNA-binding transcriptional regulator GbsR (MarR family)